GIAATSRRYTGRNASDTIESIAANGVIARRIQNARGGRKGPRSTCGGMDRRPNVRAADPARSAAAIAMAARKPTDAASTHAIGEISGRQEAENGDEISGSEDNPDLLRARAELPEVQRPDR